MTTVHLVDVICDNCEARFHFPQESIPDQSGCTEPISKVHVRRALKEAGWRFIRVTFGAFESKLDICPDCSKLNQPLPPILWFQYERIGEGDSQLRGGPESSVDRDSVKPGR